MRPAFLYYLVHIPATGASHHDPPFERPDLVEDDYYRFRHQPRGR